MTESEVKDLVKTKTVQNVRVLIRHCIETLEGVLSKEEGHDVLLHLEGALVNLRFVEVEAQDEGKMSGTDEES